MFDQFYGGDRGEVVLPSQVWRAANELCRESIHCDGVD